MIDYLMLALLLGFIGIFVHEIRELKDILIGMALLTKLSKLRDEDEDDNERK